MSIVKRKRGRPRLDESHEYNEFDLNLIQEFKKNPVLYDRTHPEHRNREYTERIWNRVAHNIKASSNHIKNRILQLRNRYNVEKRRIEAMQEQRPDACVTSQWNLYKYLTFLNDYTKSRRPYNSLPSSAHRRRTSQAATVAATTLSDADDEPNDTQTVVNGNMESSDDLTNSQNFTNSLSQMPNVSNGNVPFYDIMVKNSTRLDAGRGSGAGGDSGGSGSGDNNIGEPIGSKKFKDFGQFLASALVEMSDMQALTLINKFTNELVKTLKIELKCQNVVIGGYVQGMVNGGGGDGPINDSESINSD